MFPSTDLHFKTADSPLVTAGQGSRRTLIGDRTTRLPVATSSYIRVNSCPFAVDLYPRKSASIRG